MNYIEALQKRYSVKKFDKNKSVPRDVLERILQAGKLAASSLGMQPYEILVVQSPEVLRRLEAAFYNPSQVSTCSHLIVIVSKKKISEEYIADYFRHISDTRGTPVENLGGFRRSIEGFIAGFDGDSIAHWVDRQGYIVLGNLLMAAAIEEVDTCPMEGFDAQKMSEILELDPTKDRVNVTLALGFAAEDDPFKGAKKVRKPDEKLFKFI